MGNKFRTSLFGFNKEDVYNFMYKSRETEALLNQKVASLSDKLENQTKLNAELENKINELNKEIVIISNQLEDCKNREEALKRLSESIGKLYLVANTNAKVMLDSAKESTTIIRGFNESSMNVANSATDEFQSISDDLSDITSQFVNEIDKLKNRLNAVKVEVNNHNLTIEQKAQELEDLINDKETIVTK